MVHQLWHLINPLNSWCQACTKGTAKKDVVLVDAWGRELALDGRESESLMEVIQDSNKRWAV